MRDIRVDTNGELRCWYCGCQQFTHKRTMKSKLAFGVGALATKKKMKCQVCNQYNDVGTAKPYKGPASKRLGRKFGTFVDMFGAEVPDDDEGPVVEEMPAGWQKDPLGRFEYRWWDGSDWTAQVAIGQAMMVDPAGAE